MEKGLQAAAYLAADIEKGLCAAMYPAADKYGNGINAVHAAVSNT